MKAAIGPLWSAFTGEHPARVFVLPLEGKDAGGKWKHARQILLAQIAREIGPAFGGRHCDSRHFGLRQRLDVVLHFDVAVSDAVALLRRSVARADFGPCDELFA